MSYLKETEGSGSFVIKVFPDEESVAQAAAQIFVEKFKTAMTRSERFSVVLSGGKTPLRTYELLAKEPFTSQVNWRHIDVFWGDERCVPVTDWRSNYKMAFETLLSHVSIPVRQIHAIPFNDEPHKAAVEYENVLRKYFGEMPQLFDLVFLGLGKDGHTASLFPNSTSLNEKVRWTTSLKNSGEDFSRITLTPQILNRTKMAIFLVTGQEKAEILKNVLDLVKPSFAFPASLIQPIQGELLWLVSL
jgi:6-phosphogluconolactonase